LKAAVVVLGCLVTLAGCGSAPAPSAKSFASQKSSAAGACASDHAAFAQARPAGSVDVDGDGSADAVKVTSGSQECPARLIAHAASGYVGGELPPGDPATPKVFGVRLAGHHGDLLVTQQDHPRGGYQLHVFANGPDGLVELKNGDQPLVPFVATDTRPIPYTVDCAKGSIIVDQAVAKPGGTWDLRESTYSVQGVTSASTASKVVAGRLSPKRIDQLMPVGKAVFPSCRS
jgi:hypothetical protein